ncbi:hypothetical protein A2Z10_00645 [Candidatus Azambacteria bacterium RBG_16_47_10]|uniref:LysM domain-containing protein n=1 Tax=Candidatus Azambacteria bacterium RBG_16_47_10 TaxID=1797292 RepID=A0A1F5AYS8_9BACT|nr:MAG: hypothetical protein A2Z10_00645 [Candidatus Azambacteria bacterium RBG_16_47_10]
MIWQEWPQRSSISTLIFTQIKNFFSALWRKINSTRSKFPVLSTGNSFFYVLSRLKNNVFTAFFVIMVLFASFFNIGDMGGALSEATISVLRSHEAYAYKEVAQRAVQVRAATADALYDASFNDAEGGRGGLDDEETSEYAYPTTKDDALVADFSPLTIDQNQTSRDQIIYYVVESGDTVSDIATRFGIESPTLLWANDLSGVDYIRAGQRLEVLPIDGVKYEVKKGDTIGALAQKFSAQEDEIITYNHLPADGALRPGDALIIPDGRMPQPKPAPRPTAIARASTPSQSAAQTASNKYFIFPTSGRKSQGYHGNNGVDIANQCGTPIYAAADGIVTAVLTTTSRARTGSAVYGGFGNHVRIKHANGSETLYAHLENIYVFKGQEVKQGSMIALMGGGFEAVNGRWVRMEGAGKSTGCHLHFEVHGAKNPYLVR